MDTVSQVGLLFDEIRAKRTLIHHITNYVTVNDCANVVLSIGANPVMADDPFEVEDMVSICDALVINIGTLNERTINSMIKAGRAANARNIPVVFDPVGVGATPFRLKSAHALIDEIKFSVIRGNMAEIKVIAGQKTVKSGVDSFENESEGQHIAQALALKVGAVIAITGRVDVISDGKYTYEIHNGDEVLTRLTGTGCMSSSLIASFLGSSHHVLHSALAGIATMGIAGEMASHSFHALGLGSFKVALMDSISKMDNEKFRKRAKIIQVS